MRRRLAALAACFALAAVGGAATASPAMAACPSGEICLYNGPSWETPDRPFHDTGLQSLGPWGLNDIISSVYNNTSRWAQLWQHTDGTSAWGMNRCIAPGNRRSFWEDPFNNEASALAVYVFGYTPSGCG